MYTKHAYAHPDSYHTMMNGPGYEVTAPWRDLHDQAYREAADFLLPQHFAERYVPSNIPTV